MRALRFFGWTLLWAAALALWVPVGVAWKHKVAQAQVLGTHVVQGSAVSSAVLKAAPGGLVTVYAECSAACWLMVFNATALPANGATTAGLASGNLQDCVAIPVGANGSISYLPPGPPEQFSVGITAAISSTTCATLTAAATGFIHGVVQ